MSRANWYKCRRKRQSEEVDGKLICQLVRDERKLQPRLGARKVRSILRHEFSKAGISIGRDRFFDVMRRNDMLVPPLPKRFVYTTDSKHNLPYYGNLVSKLSPTRPNEVWVSDITYIRLIDDFLYLSLIMDLGTRKIVGHHCSRGLAAEETTTEALRSAVRGLPAEHELIHHSDRGAQYCCHDYVNLLDDYGIRPSMTEVNHCAENSHAERLNGILKQEYMLGATFRNFAQAQQAVRQAVSLYNHRRPHNSLNGKTPAEAYAADHRVIYGC